MTGFLGNDFESIPVDGCIVQPSDNLESAGMFSSSESTFITEEALKN